MARPVLNGAVIEVNARTGRLLRTLSGGRYGFRIPVAIVTDGSHVWVTSGLGNSVTELSASDGSWITTVHGILSPVALALTPNGAWVLSSPVHGTALVIQLPRA